MGARDSERAVRWETGHQRTVKRGTAVANSQSIERTTCCWRDGAGRLLLTVIGKATFELRRSGTSGDATLGLVPAAAAKVPPPSTGRADQSGATRWDDVPCKARADVLVVGADYTPGGPPPARGLVGLAVARGPEIIVARQLGVLQEDRGTPPRIVDLEGRPCPLGFGPMPVPAAVEAIAVGAGEGARPEGTPFVLPENFDGEMLQAAPREQQLAELRGGEQILLAGMAPSGCDLLFRLPQLGAIACVPMADGHDVALPLIGDTIWIDLDRELVRIVWRCTIELDETRAGGLDADAIRVTLAPAGSVEEVLGEPTSWRLHRARLTNAHGRGAAEDAMGRPAIVNRSPLQAATFPWTFEPGREHPVLVLKGTFALRHHAPAVLADVQEPLCGDLHHEDRPVASLRYPSDFVPVKPQADVLLVGKGYPGADGNVGHVALRVGSAVDKRVALLGPRRWLAPDRPSEPLAFESIALRWEHAYGGASCAANPVGKGADKASEQLPELEWPDRLIRRRGASSTPAGFGPLARSWRLGSSATGTYDARWRRERWPFLPADFDPSFFNAAPVDQRCAFLTSREAYRLAGVCPDAELLEGSLPGWQPRAFALRMTDEGAEARLSELRLALDTVVFDAERREVVLVWRAAAHAREDGSPKCHQIIVLPDEPDPDMAADRAWLAHLAERDGRFSAQPSRRQPAPRPLAPDGGGDDSPAEAPTPRSAVPWAALVHLKDSARRARASLGALGAGSFAQLTAPPPALSRSTIAELVAQGASLARRDLSGADLSDLDLRHADLRGTVLRDARLRGARLDETQCAGACFAGADAARASFLGADLSRSDFTGANLANATLTEAKLERATLGSANLEQADLQRAKASGASFVGAQLVRARLDEADLAKADLSKATLDESTFRRSRLDDAKAYEARGAQVTVEAASARDARFDEASFDELDAKRIDATGSSWEGASLRRASFEHATLREVGFVGARLVEASLEHADARQARFRGAELARARLGGANLMQASFEGADLRGADLRNANLYQVETWRARLDTTKLDGALVAGSKLGP